MEYNQYENYDNNNNMYDDDDYTQGARIKIVGVGGAGGNAVNDMINSNLVGVEYLAINTDYQALKESKAKEKISLGRLGAGGNPEVARNAAEEKKSEIKKALQNQDMIFITAGMGGGTGTGASPIVAQIAKELGILTVAIVTTPFMFELNRKKVAQSGLEELQKYVDCLIVIPNEKLINLPNAVKLSFLEQMSLSNDTLKFGVKGITDLIMKRGIINLDFADVKNIMTNSGIALFGFADGQRNEETGEYESLVEIAQRAMLNPLLDRDIKGARKVLINFTIPLHGNMTEISEAARIINERSNGNDADAVNMSGVIMEDRENYAISIIATDFADNIEEPESKEEIVRNLYSDNDENDRNENMEYHVPTFG